MSKGNITVLGINGHIGRRSAEAFRDAGWAVTGFGRSNRHGVTGITVHIGDAQDSAAMRAATAGADVVFNGLNLPYDKWGNGRAEAQTAAVIAAMHGPQQTLLHPASVYNYQATDRIITPAMAQNPQTPRGGVRMRQEQMLEAASKAGKFQTLVLRGGDYYGPDAGNDWFEQAMLVDAGKGIVRHLGDLPLHHAWAYLPDLARAFVVITEQRQSLGRYENFHFAGHYVTHEAMIAAIRKAAPAALQLKPYNWGMIGVIGLAVPLLRELVKMRYLWTHEMALADPRLEAMLGQGFGTPFEEAVAGAVRGLLAGKRVAA